MTDILVNLKTPLDEDGSQERLIPRTFAEAVVETEDKQFISRELKDEIKKKQDKLEFIPVNRDGDTMTGELRLLYQNFKNKDSAATVKFVEDKIGEIVNSSPELLDTLYELARAIGNDPDFATTVTNLIGAKLDKKEVVYTKAPNKVLRLNAVGNLEADIQGNASTASRLKEEFSLNFEGDLDSSVKIDGSRDVNVNINLPRASNTIDGIITADMFSRLNSMTSGFGGKYINIYEDEFIEQQDETYMSSYSIVQSTRIEYVEAYRVDILESGEERREKILVDISINKNGDNQQIKIRSLQPFEGILYYK